LCPPISRTARVVAARGHGATEHVPGAWPPFGGRSEGCAGSGWTARRPGPAAERSEPRELRVGLADSLGAITEVHENRGIVHRDHAAQAVPVVSDLIAEREGLDRPDHRWGVEGTSGQWAPLRGVGWLHHFQYAPVSLRLPDGRGGKFRTFGDNATRASGHGAIPLRDRSVPGGRPSRVVRPGPGRDGWRRGRHRPAPEPDAAGSPGDGTGTSPPVPLSTTGQFSRARRSNECTLAQVRSSLRIVRMF
jgi:hypothetical protein